MLNIIEGGYLRDILDQPRALADTLVGLEVPDISPARFDRILLTGMGSSLYALYPLYLHLLRAGHSVVWIETSELIHTVIEAVRGNTLSIVVSQSGRSAETVRLLDHKRAFTVAVTNTPDSPLALQADVVLLTRAGAEVTVACKTYLASLLALAWLDAALMGRDMPAARDELSHAAPAVAGYLGAWHERVEAIAAQIGQARHLFYLGRGESLAAVANAGLTTKESTHLQAEGMSAAAFRHGPFEMLTSGLFAMVWEGGERVRALNHKLTDEVVAAGGRAALAGVDGWPEACRLPAVPEAVRPIVEMLPAQLATLALAARQGREAGRFERLTKVTDTE